ncbi:MAG TPA: bifunctional (p)ppGpp synthetase/guanosine-3',5'-bis(diphosphate) 3'-pyrophosphohydrolase [Fimbriimonadales bacterium]|nr:bifunctional (p)ppGpp synthetase/guanosine-3',5'-bis(diphosphate) 3'-pyrophosphohydrolase [Fimbriimonadales bacterium]
MIREQHPKADVQRIRRAYYLAEIGHRGQTRKTGEPYVMHPLAVAKILAELHMDTDTIAAGLLHDLIEDTPITREQIRENFGESVLSLVEGVTKLEFPPLPKLSEQRMAAEKRERFAETLKKMLIAMATDIRVMVIKLADRLHNLQTLQVLDEEAQKRIAQETLEIYAPLAARLGIWQIKWQLEDLAFKFLYPEEFERISELVAKTRTSREQEVHEAIVMIKERLEQAGYHHFEVTGRPKHLYSIYQKMAIQGFEFEEIYDLLGIRIIVDTEADCYKVLGIVHELWMPIPGLFFDYIAKAKPNGYQSLHTKVVGPRGEPLEVQIRTFDMHRTAEYGVASHWQYKPGDKGKLSATDQAKINMLRQQIFEWSNETSRGTDFLTLVSNDLFGEQVFTFTPKGDVIDLPRGATPIDFAFRVHTNVGLHTAGARVNGRIVRLDYELDNGDIVEVITRANASPSVDWLRFVKTASARAKIRGYLRQANKEVNAQRGKEALERELKSMGLDHRAILTETKLEETARTLHKNDAKTLLALVGEGLVPVQRVIAKLTAEARKREGKAGLAIRPGGITQEVLLAPGDVDNVAFRRSRCCLPVPGDETVGFISKGRGIILHRKLCPNFQKTAESEPKRVVNVNWPRDGKNLYPVNLRVQTVNRQGLLAEISSVLSETKINVSAATIRTLPNQTALLDLTVDVHDLHHLQSMINKLSVMQDVISIQRTFGGKATK